MINLKESIINNDRLVIRRWDSENKRNLPWRRTKDPYKIWISEIMLQQTKVATVIPYYKKWMKSFPTAEKLAAASESKVLKHWEGLGYYSRARNLRKSAIQIPFLDNNLNIVTADTADYYYTDKYAERLGYEDIEDMLSPYIPE